MADDPKRSRNGTFKPGVSGNPGGKAKPRTDAAPTAPGGAGGGGGNRFDGWQNFFSGHGVYGRDKRQGTSFKAATLTFDQLAELWRGDDLAARAVETLPKESLREGYDLSIPEAAQGGEDEAERIAEIVDALSTLGADEMIRTGLCYERGLGGGAVLIGANDGQDDLTKPLRLESIRSLDWLTPLEPREIMPVYGYADPRAPKYGQPEIYRITSRTILPPQDGKYGNQVMDIHESRLLVFPGIRVSRYQYMASQGGWGDSVLIRMWRVLRDFNLAWGSAGALVTEFASATYKMKDLWQALSTKGGAAAFAERLQAMDLARSTINATVIDGEDDFKREQTPISGLPDLMDKFSTRLAAAADMPLTLLFGTSPAGLNATGESDIRFFYDRVAAYQRDKVLPQLKTLIRILFRTLGSKVEPEKWDIEFRPLWQESAADKAKAMLTQAQADHIWVTDGMLSAEEVADAHWGTGKWVPDLRVDFEARERQEAAAAAPVTQADFAAMGRGPNGQLLQPAPGQRQLIPGPAQFGRPQPPQPGFGQPVQRQLQPGPQMPGQGPAQPGQAPGAAAGPKPPGAGASKLGASGYRYAPDVTQRGQGADEDIDSKPRSMVLSNDSGADLPAGLIREDYSPDQERAADGKFGSGSGSGGAHPTEPTSGEHAAEAGSFEEAAHAWTSHKMTSEQFKAEVMRRKGEVDAHKDAVKAFQAKLTPIESQVCSGYSNFGEIVNGALRAGRPPSAGDEKKAIAALDSAIKKSKAPSDTVVYRGIHSEHDPLSHLKPGVVIQDKGYVSTTGSREIAHEFAQTPGPQLGRSVDPNKTHVIVRIKVPKGHALAPIPSNYSYEHEYLLPRGSKFKINSVAKEGTTTIVDAEAL